MKIGVFTDMHLGNRQYGLEERENDFYSQYFKAIDLFIQNDVDCVICAGDVFDKSRPSPRSLKVFIEGVRKLEENSINFLNIIGNHSLIQSNDFITPDEILLEIFSDSSYILLDEQNTYATDEVFIAGLPYHFQFETENFLEKVKDLNNLAKKNSSKLSILVLHQSFQEYSGFPGEDMSIGDLDISNFDLIICGHIHSFVLAEITDNQIYLGPGSLERSSVAEARDEENQGKGIFIINTDNCNTDSIMNNFVRIRSDRKFFISDMYMNSENDISEIKNEILDAVKECNVKPILFLTVHDKSNSYVRLMNFVKDLNEYCLTVHFNYFDESIQEELLLSSTEDMPTPAEALRIALNPLDEDERNLGLDLFNILKGDGNPQELLDSFLEKRKRAKLESDKKDEEFYDQDLKELIEYFEEK